MENISMAYSAIWKGTENSWESWIGSVTVKRKIDLLAK